jgi:hypothetical protein
MDSTIITMKKTEDGTIQKTKIKQKYKPPVRKVEIVNSSSSSEDEAPPPQVKKQKQKIESVQVDESIHNYLVNGKLEKLLTDEERESLAYDIILESNTVPSGIEEGAVQDNETPIPVCHNIVSTSQIVSSMVEIDLQRLASLFPFTSYDRKRFAAITIRLANPHCTCLLFGSGKLVITGSTSFHACIVASQSITEMLREVNQRYRHF